MSNAQSRPGLLGGLPNMILLIVAAALIAFGAYRLYQGSTPAFGTFFIGLGLVFIPVPVIAIIGSVVCMGAGGFWFFRYGVSIQPVLFVVVGLISLADHARAMADARSLEASQRK